MAQIAETLARGVFTIGGLPEARIDNITYPAGNGSWDSGMGATSQVVRVARKYEPKKGTGEMHLEAVRSYQLASVDGTLSGLGVVTITDTPLDGPAAGKTCAMNVVFDDPDISKSTSSPLSTVNVTFTVVANSQVGITFLG